MWTTEVQGFDPSPFEQALIQIKRMFPSLRKAEDYYFQLDSHFRPLGKALWNFWALSVCQPLPLHHGHGASEVWSPNGMKSWSISWGCVTARSPSWVTWILRRALFWWGVFAAGTGPIGNEGWALIWFGEVSQKKWVTTHKLLSPYPMDGDWNRWHACRWNPNWNPTLRCLAHLMPAVTHTRLKSLKP